MVSKTEVTPHKEEMLEKEGPETPATRPLGRRRQEVDPQRQETRLCHPRPDQRIASSEEVKSEQIEDILAKFTEMGVNVVETEEAEPEEGRARRRARGGGESEDELVEVRQSRRQSRTRHPPSAPTTRCACICAKWVPWNSFPARARSPSPSASRPAARP